MKLQPGSCGAVRMMSMRQGSELVSR